MGQEVAGDWGTMELRSSETPHHKNSTPRPPRSLSLYRTCSSYWPTREEGRWTSRFAVAPDFPRMKWTHQMLTATFVMWQRAALLTVAVLVSAVSVAARDFYDGAWRLQARKRCHVERCVPRCAGAAVRELTRPLSPAIGSSSAGRCPRRGRGEH